MKCPRGAVALLATLMCAVGTVVPAPAAGAQDVAREAAVNGAASAQETPGEAAPAAPADADLREAELDELAAEVAAELRCPVCRNQSVLESSAELSREMHGVIRERLAAGESPEQVKAYFVSRYGEWILLKPTARGINVLVYLLPLAGLVLGAVLVRGRLRRWSGGGRAPGAVEASAGADASGAGESGWTGLNPDERRWLEEAVRER